MAQSPAVPSSSTPLRTTPITRGPNAVAAERNSTSIQGLARPSFGPRLSRTPCGVTMRCRSGEATYTCPCAIDWPSSAMTTGSDVAFASTRSSRLGVRGGMCSTTTTTTTGASRCAGSALKNPRSASTPPADAPTTTMSRWGNAEFFMGTV